MFMISLSYVFPKFLVTYNPIVWTFAKIKKK